MKKTFRLLFVFFLVALLSACSSADYSNQTIVGKISKIEGNTITLELGDVLENEQDVKILQFDGEAPQMSENGMPPQMNGEMPELPENGELPQMPQMNDALQSQKTYTFIANDKMVEVNLESIGVTLDDLTIESVVKVGDVIGVSFGSNNSIESIKFYTISE